MESQIEILKEMIKVAEDTEKGLEELSKYLANKLDATQEQKQGAEAWLKDARDAIKNFKKDLSELESKSLDT